MKTWLSEWESRRLGDDEMDYELSYMSPSIVAAISTMQGVLDMK